jgi:hypothetical protein
MSEASAVSAVSLYVYSEFTPEGGCTGGDGYSALFIGRIKPKSSGSDSYIECYENILPSQSLLTNMISNKDYSCCGGFNRFNLLVVDENTTNEDRENFEREDEDYYYERRNEYSYLELLKLLGDKETIEID